MPWTSAEAVKARRLQWLAQWALVMLLRRARTCSSGQLQLQQGLVGTSGWTGTMQLPPLRRQLQNMHGMSLLVEPQPWKGSKMAVVMGRGSWGLVAASVRPLW